MADIQSNEDNWQRNILTFHTYLQNTVELLAHKRENADVDAPSSQNPRIAASSKKAKAVHKVKHFIPAHLTSEDEVRAAFERSKTKPYSSPLWVALGDENPGRSNTKTRHTSTIIS